MEATERLFLGIHLYPLFEAEIEAAAARLKKIYPDQKWVNLKHVHFTIHFLGETNLVRKEKVKQIAREVASRFVPFEIALKGMGAFPDLKTPRVIWIGAAEVCRASLDRLYKQVVPPLIAEGFPAEHDTFTPHATLFRVYREKPMVWNEADFYFPQTESRKVDRFFLFKSVPTPKGSEYEPQDEFLFSQTTLPRLGETHPRE